MANISYSKNDATQKQAVQTARVRGLLIGITVVLVGRYLFYTPVSTADGLLIAEQRAQIAEERASRMEIQEEDGTNKNKKMADELDAHIIEKRKRMENLDARTPEKRQANEPAPRENTPMRRTEAKRRLQHMLQGATNNDSPEEIAISRTEAKERLQSMLLSNINDYGNKNNHNDNDKDIRIDKSIFENSRNEDEDEDETAIREWGCARNETPFIFVHIGKAGGGGVRSRMAAAALDYNRTGWHRTHEDPHYYYPIYDDAGQLHKARFLSSKHTNYIHPDRTEFHGEFLYEGHGPCGAATPIGHAVACPIESPYCEDHDQDGISDGRCDLIYMGHNTIGSELHWLPTKYLVQWWKTTLWGRQTGDFIGDTIADRHTAIHNQEWKLHPKLREIAGDNKIPTLQCQEGPYTYRPFKAFYKTCFQPKEQVVDAVTRHVVGNDSFQYAKMMASMPILRVTVLREPFSWLTSKFFWHRQHDMGNGTLVGPDLGSNSKNDKRKATDASKGEVTPPLVKCDDLDAAVGWAGNRAMAYIFYLCGEFCIGGWADGTMTLEDLERQGAYNLRHSFAVVGLLHKTDDFYNMVSQRVSYMDTSLNPEVEGQMHGSGSGPENFRCKDVYRTPEFQKALLKRSPAMATLHRLYKIAIEVNAFQAKELAKCSAS